MKKQMNHPQHAPAERKRPNKGRPEQDINTERNNRSATTPSADTQQTELRAASNKPVTNQDEQRKTTNAGNSDEPMGEQETEGDRRRYRLRPHLSPVTEYGMAERTRPVM
jgi:hypothetical protein